MIVNDPDDRLSTVPTNWWTYSHQSAQDVTNTASSQNARIVDISVEQSAPSLTFTVTYVENTGPYYKPWSWYAGIDAATLAKALTTNNARLTSLKAFDAGGGQIRFMAVMIVNAGKDTKTSWYYTDLTPDQITSNLAANNARLTQISSYLSGGKIHYAAVMVAKRPAMQAPGGTPAMPSAQITSLLSANNARLIDLDYIAVRWQLQRDHGRLRRRGCPASSWYTGQTQSQMQGLATQNAGRIIDSQLLCRMRRPVLFLHPGGQFPPASRRRQPDHHPRGDSCCGPAASMACRVSISSRWEGRCWRTWRSPSFTSLPAASKCWRTFTP